MPRRLVIAPAAPAAAVAAANPASRTRDERRASSETSDAGRDAFIASGRSERHASANPGTDERSVRASTTASDDLGRALQRVLALLHLFAELLEELLAELLLRVREELTLLFLDVVLDVLLEHGDLGVVLLVLGLHPGDLRDQQLGDVMLLVRLADLVLELFRALRLHGRIEDRLLDVHVDRELGLDPFEDLLLGLVGLVSCRFELLEELLHGLVVLNEQRCRFHLVAPCRKTSGQPAIAGSGPALGRWRGVRRA